VPSFPLPLPQKPQYDYDQDVREWQRKRQMTEAILNEAARTFIHYDLPSCYQAPGASAYRQAFNDLLSMTDSTLDFSIRDATFIVENAFFENKNPQDDFNDQISEIGDFLRSKMHKWNYPQSSNRAKNFALFRFFTDTLSMPSGESDHIPFTYDFEDYLGREDWSKMFVQKALQSNSGQCHSLPLLYLILAEEIGAEAQLAYSPNHTYIKFEDEDGHWHNVELTNGMMSTDAFILQSGYIEAEALQNGIYLYPLNERQLLAHSLFDLANGYAHKYCYDAFVEEVIEKALELDPSNIHAHLLKADCLSLRFHYVAGQLGINEQNFRQLLYHHPRAKDLLLERNAQYDRVDQMGYTEMPSAAYEAWLASMNEERQKQESQALRFNMNPSLDSPK